jgi:predicted amidohydrolase YtcJ
VLPGLIDAHTHLTNLGESFLRLNLKDAKTEEDVARLVAERARSAKPGEWITGWGWDEGLWAASYPNHEKLTAAAPANPVYLAGLHSFAAWVNRRALEIAAVSRATPDPPNGRILRDASGEPTGIFVDRAQTLVSRHIAAPDLAHTKRAIEIAAKECLRVGLTSVHEARVSARELQAYRELIAEGKLPLRIYVMLDGADRALTDDWLTRGPEKDASNRLTVRSIKLFADGALGSRGALLFQPYADRPETTGVATTPEAQVYELTRRALNRGFQVATHAIGDKANHYVLDAYERAIKETGSADHRLRVEHAQVLTSGDIPRFAKLRVIASMQPSHCTSDMAWAEQRIGPARIRGAYAWRSVLKTGARLPLSSDFPGETHNPFEGMYATVTRQDSTGNPPGGWYPDERLGISDALGGYTVEAAYAEFAEREKGSIAPGKLADLIVVPANPARISPPELLRLRVRMVMIGGRTVWSIND